MELHVLRVTLEATGPTLSARWVPQGMRGSCAVGQSIPIQPQKPLQGGKGSMKKVFRPEGTFLSKERDIQSWYLRKGVKGRRSW